MARVIHNSTTVPTLKAKERVSNPSREAYRLLSLGAFARLSREFDR